MKNWEQHVVKRRAMDARISISQLAKEAGTSPYHVRKALEQRALEAAKLAAGDGAPESALDSETSFAYAAKATGLSIPKLAKLVGCDAQTLAGYLRGNRVAPMSVLYLVRMVLARGPDAVRNVQQEGADMHAAIETRRRRALKKYAEG